MDTALFDVSSLNILAGKAMGWRLSHYDWVSPEGTVIFSVEFNALKSKAHWNPCDNYNQSMILRDKCIELGLINFYISALVDITRESRQCYGRHGLATSTAEEITKAAIKVLKTHAEEK